MKLAAAAAAAAQVLSTSCMHQHPHRVSRWRCGCQRHCHVAYRSTANAYAGPPHTTTCCQLRVASTNLHGIVLAACCHCWCCRWQTKHPTARSHTRDSHAQQCNGTVGSGTPYASECTGKYRHVSQKVATTQEQVCVIRCCQCGRAARAATMHAWHDRCPAATT
jgi:hypothetical protein